MTLTTAAMNWAISSYLSTPNQFFSNCNSLCCPAWQGNTSLAVNTFSINCTHQSALKNLTFDVAAYDWTSVCIHRKTLNEFKREAFHVIERLSPALLLPFHESFIWKKKKWMQSYGKREVIFLSHLACAMNYTYDGWQIERFFFNVKKVEYYRQTVK